MRASLSLTDAQGLVTGGPQAQTFTLAPFFFFSLSWLLNEAEGVKL